MTSTPSSVKIGHLVFEAKGDSTIPLINTACPWASDYKDLERLYHSPHTSGITTRTALLSAKEPLSSFFEEDLSVHSVKFLQDSADPNFTKGSINSYGYSPNPLKDYLVWIERLLSDSTNSLKPVIISVTGSPEAVELVIKEIIEWSSKPIESQHPVGEVVKIEDLIAVEINTSCPNIRGVSTPSGYDPQMILKYLEAIDRAQIKSTKEGKSVRRSIPIGLKLPPYTYAAQFQSIISILSKFQPRDENQWSHPISFLTSTNTLGSSMWFSQDPNSSSSNLTSTLPQSTSSSSSGLGGLGGEPLHPLSLGNVFQLRTLLDQDEDTRLREIVLIGVGGVVDSESALRMKKAGAGVVGLATALGREGVEVFEKILNGLGASKAS